MLSQRSVFRLFLGLSSSPCIGWGKSRVTVVRRENIIMINKEHKKKLCVSCTPNSKRTFAPPCVCTISLLLKGT